MANVLVIDDSRLSVSALQKMIRDLGHEVVDVAYSGEEGIDKMKGTDADIVCLDMVMPGIDGIETAKELRREKAGVRIIMITQNEVDTSAKNQIQAIHYIVKPITSAKLREAFSKI
jgi:two-component SAPR family response regulator